MRKGIKKIIAITAATMAFGAVALSACTASFTPPVGDYTSATDAVSNGGFVVEYGNYVYFINGVESYTSDNTYGKPVKGALMRVLKSDLLAGRNNAQTVVPSLMVSADRTAGFFIYDGRVYYATPNNVPNTSGVIENEYLDFKSAKLDGTDIQSYLRVEDNATVYRFVQTEGSDTVYLVYEEDDDLHSYNTVSGANTVLAQDVTAFVANASDKTDPYFYYTMAVADHIDSDTARVSLPYNQIYRVRADATEAPYEYSWDQEYLDAHEGEAPYVNLGAIVLDGIGETYLDYDLPFTHGDATGVTLRPVGYTYALQKYDNDGVYFTRRDLTNAGETTGAGADLYYVAESAVGASDWNSIGGNADDSLELVANSTNTGKASASALFYRDGDGTHHYIYVQDENMIRADVLTDGNAEEQVISTDASGATLIALDSTSDAAYRYVWYSRSNGSGYSVERAVYNGTERDYAPLPFEDEDNAAFQPVTVLNLQHATNWYPFEVIGGVLYIADAEALGSTSYNYVSAINLNADGKLMNNAEIEALNDKYEAMTDSDSKVGYLAELTADGEQTLSAALRYYYYTGETELFYKTIQNAVDAGRSNVYLYTQEQQDAFKAFTEGTGEDALRFVDDSGKSYRTRDYFITRLGAVSEADKEAIDAHWAGLLERYEAPQTDNSLEDWEWALIGVAIALALIGVALGVFFGLRARHKREEGAPKAERMKVDTTDDRSIDVYADEEAEEKSEEEAEEAQETEETEALPEEAEAENEPPQDEE